MRSQDDSDTEHLNPNQRSFARALLSVAHARWSVELSNRCFACKRAQNPTNVRMLDKFGFGDPQHDSHGCKCSLRESRKSFQTSRPFRRAENPIQDIRGQVLCMTCRTHHRTNISSSYSCNPRPMSIFLSTFVLGGLLVLHLEGSLNIF